MHCTMASTSTTARSYTKRWHLVVEDDNTLCVIKGGLPVKDRAGKHVGPVTALNQPKSRKACQQASSYLAHAIEVQCTHELTQLLYKQTT